MEEVYGFAPTSPGKMIFFYCCKSLWLIEMAIWVLTEIFLGTAPRPRVSVCVSLCYDVDVLGCPRVMMMMMFLSLCVLVCRCVSLCVLGCPCVCPCVFLGVLVCMCVVFFFLVLKIPGILEWLLSIGLIMMSSSTHNKDITYAFNIITIIFINNNNNNNNNIC